MINLTFYGNQIDFQDLEALFKSIYLDKNVSDWDDRKCVRKVRCWAIKCAQKI